MKASIDVSLNLGGKVTVRVYEPVLGTQHKPQYDVAAVSLTPNECRELAIRLHAIAAECERPEHQHAMLTHYGVLTGRTKPSVKELET